ncbi:MAG: ATP-binding protein [bacterium]|nr:ATP-binding protein [bacterium]
MKTGTKKYVVMCVGYTHTGKTTFAKALVKKHPNTIQIDSDEIAVFTKEKYPLVVESSYNKTRPDFKNLKMFIFKDVYDASLKTGFNIILSNGNLAKKTRSFVARKAKKEGYGLITIYFNLPEDIILKRLEKTEKSNKVFIQSKTWAEVFNRQKKYSQFPPSKKNTIYFEIKDDADHEIVMKELGKLI